MKITKETQHYFYCDNGKTYSAYIKWDGCCELYVHHNGSPLDEKSGEDVDRVHVCNLKEFIKWLERIEEEGVKRFDWDE